MGSINLNITEYRVENIEVSCVNNKWGLVFNVGLYDDLGTRLSQMVFCSDGMFGPKFVPTEKANDLLRELLIELDNIVENKFINKIED